MGTVESARCFKNEDREIVYQTIENWFGSLEEFNKEVKTEVLAYTLQAVPNKPPFPPRILGPILLPAFFNVLDWTLSFVEFGDTFFTVAMTIQTCFSLLLMILVMDLAFHLASMRIISRKRNSVARDVLISVVTGELLLAVVLGLMMFFRMQAERPFPLIIIALGLLSILRGHVKYAWKLCHILFRRKKSTDTGVANPFEPTSMGNPSKPAAI